MNKTKLILFTLVIIILAFGVLYGIRMSIQNPVNSEIILETIGSEITATSTMYVSETGDEVNVSYYSNKTAILTIIGSEYKDIQFTSTTSASGARYENVDKELELWEKNSELTIYKSGEELFSGKKYELLAQEKIASLLPNTTWIWIKTQNGTGPMTPDVSIIIPSQTDAFSLTFNSDGNVKGTTDCNSFGGSYSIEGNQIKFGNFMSTMMYCEGSQERVFLSILKESSVYIQGEDLIFENDQTIFFKKKTE